MVKNILKNKPLCITIIVTFVAVIAGTAFLLFFNGTEDDDNIITGSIISVSAMETTGHGVETDTGFMLQCSEPMSKEDVAASIAVIPELNYALLKKADDQYLLTFDTELEPDSIVSFEDTQSIKPHSWAFQTENVFRVTGTLPADKGNGVPVNSGIEVSLSFLDVVNFKDSFKIEPAVSGSFELRNKTWVFVPQSLKPDTLYTVTIDKNLKSSGGELLGEDYAFSFRTEMNYPDDSSYLYTTGEKAETFTPDALPVVEVQSSDHFNNTVFAVDVYKFTDAASYLDALLARYTYIDDQLGYEDNYFSPTAGLEKVSSFETQIQRSNPEYRWSEEYIVLPGQLAAGDYLIDINAKDSTAQCGGHLQKYIQIHPYAVYAMSVNGSELVWVNDTVSGLPVSGAEVGINTLKGETASDGTLSIDTSALEDDDFTTLTVQGGGLPFVTQIDLDRVDDYYDIYEKYYTYIYTDREQYQPDDTISVWGVVHSKDGKSQPPKEAELQLGYGEGLVKTKVTLDASGAFSGKLTISGLAADYYPISLSDTAETYCSTDIEVGEYVKPAYIISPSVDKPVYFGWQPVNLTTEVTFFDGTPAGNMPFIVYYDSCGEGTEINVSSDSAGKFASVLKYNDGYDSWYPNTLYYSVRTAAAEDVQVESGGAEVLILPRDIMVDTDLEEKPDGFSLAVQTNKIDISSVKKEQDVYENGYANIRGAAVDVPITVKIIEVTWIKTQIGSYYDFINKVTVPQYKYDRVEKQVEARQGVTVNGSLVFDKLVYQNSPEQYYYAIVECRDTRGGDIRETIQLYSDIYPYHSDIKYFRFSHNSYGALALDETVKINLLENDLPYSGQGQMLYAVVQNGLGDYRTVPAPSFDYTFTKKDIPNISIYGAYFDGKHIYAVSQDSLTYDPSAMELKVEVVPSEQSFLPGDEAGLAIKVTDKNNDPVKGAAVCVSVVDEAAFAVADQYADPLNDIYSQYFYQYVHVYTSYLQHDFDGTGGAEEGGEGETEGFRKNFLDTAAFLTVNTDNAGKAQLTFKLPDDLTSWRVTTQAIADGVYAGKDRTNIVTTKPFFASLIVNKIFIAGDDLSAAVRGFGTALKSGDEVSFTATLIYPDGSEKDLKANAKAGEYVNFDFGSGPEGSYTLRVSAQSSAGTDGIEKTFQVVGSALEIPITKTFALSDGIDINALRSPVTLSFFDKSSALYFDCLWDLVAGSGVRADIQVSRTVAQGLLQEYYGKELPYYFYGTQSEKPAVGSFQNYNGGVRMLSYSETYADLTAKMCAAAPEYLNTAAAVGYMQAILEESESTPEEVAAAYMGLAALHQPVLLDVQYLLANQAADFTLREKLYLIAALALIGDMDGAAKYYDTIVSPLVKTNDPWIYVDSGDTMDNDIECTALALYTALKTGNDSAAGMLRYIVNNPANEITTCMEKLFYVKLNPQSKTAPASFSYTVDGEKKTVQLEKDRPYMLSMTTEQLASAGFKTVSGEIEVSASYAGGVKDVVDQNVNFVTLVKTVEPAAGIKQSGLVKITITPTFKSDAPKGWYELSDYVPSGMRYVSCEENWGYNWRMQSIEGQKISFSVFNVDTNPAGEYYTNYKVKPIVYYVRATLLGDFVVDSAYIKHTETKAWGMSERKEIMIGE